MHGALTFEELLYDGSEELQRDITLHCIVTYESYFRCQYIPQIFNAFICKGIITRSRMQLGMFE